MSGHTTELYFECHITIDPVFSQARMRAESLAKKYDFKLAKLLMDKGVHDAIDLELSKLDTFMTGHDVNYENLKERMIMLISQLNHWGYKVRRYKIENTLLDSRNQNDPLNLIPQG